MGTKARDRRSIAVRVCRAWFCSNAVTKDCGKKKLGTENVRGWPSSSQEAMNAVRAHRSRTHGPSALSEGYAAADQICSVPGMS